MRRSDREITSNIQIKEILDKADVCRIAFGNPRPYIVAMNFGYIWTDNLTIYFHCANEGKKIDLLEQNSEICFQLDTNHQLITHESACTWGMKYASITGYGHLSKVTDPAEKTLGLNSIMKHYGFAGEPLYNEKVFTITTVLKLNVTEISCKRKQ
ncbi:MAG: pyridoxamine 5'-phosphate oxidase family protein [Fibrobacter sp.]|nr:pyridoxamine 5'-phosphate oxidase family protein [Fibrobacter sp.]